MDDAIVVLWLLSGIAGTIILIAKGYAGGLANWGCIVWILFGWWGLLIIPALGPITLLIALSLKAKKRCPYCRELIAGDAIRCPKCQADLTVQPSVQ
jgi:hypothetical protein